MKFVDRIINSVNAKADEIKDHIMFMSRRFEDLEKYLKASKPPDTSWKDKVIEEQQETINRLIGNIGDYDKTEIFIYKTYRGNIIAYVNGERVDREKMRKLTLWWEFDGVSTVEVE